jgi:hypothetical protein
MNLEHEPVKMNPPFLHHHKTVEKAVHEIGFTASRATPQIHPPGRRATPKWQFSPPWQISDWRLQGFIKGLQQNERFPLVAVSTETTAREISLVSL